MPAFIDPTLPRLRSCCPLLSALSIFASTRIRHGLRLGVLLLALAFCQVRAWDVNRVLEAAAAMGPRTLSEARALQAVVDKAASQDAPKRLEMINDFFNKHIQYGEDIDVWGQIDYWAAPLEALDKGRGDCEDYAIGKYFSLLAAGVPQAQLRMVYVRAMFQGRSQAHMVLAFYEQPTAVPVILDNLIPEIRPASQRPDLTPVFSFNGEGLWSGVGATSAGNPVLRLSQWRDVLNKAKQEGF